MQKELTCFKAYDIRGEININIDEAIAYRIGRSVAQHFNAKSIVVAFDARETSPTFSKAVGLGIMDAGSDLIDIGLSGTEEMYWAVSNFSACAGIVVTASHNPINYNGMKIVKSGSKPLDDDEDFLAIKSLAESQNWTGVKKKGSSLDLSNEARAAYVSKTLSFVDINAFKPLKIVVNSGNGAAGPTFDAIEKRLNNNNTQIEFVRVDHNPDSTFPNGIPNPLLPENHHKTADIVKDVGADFGVAFDGDFDRCFFFDETGEFIPGEYLVGLFASIFLAKEPGSTIVHDPRVIWNTQDIVSQKGGKAEQSKTGHAFIKQTMRKHEAIYGGEMSAHHYFRDFAYCDSGMIPWLLIAELISLKGKSLGDLVKDRVSAYPSSGEINFTVKDANSSISSVLENFESQSKVLDEMDGYSLAFDNWRFNLRKSNTEPLVRLNIESRGPIINLESKVKEISELLNLPE
ncbi:phosphomannomutase [bacterium]|nr:phosphomannomutase [Amylibacter sp.]MDC1488523.1 phosphomannomutase [bacterium]